MPKYEVTYVVSEIYSVKIDADNADDAREAFWEIEELNADHHDTYIEDILSVDAV